jgi:hypothetical protein
VHIPTPSAGMAQKQNRNNLFKFWLSDNLLNSYYFERFSNHFFKVRPFVHVVRFEVVSAIDVNVIVLCGVMSSNLVGGY